MEKIEIKSDAEADEMLASAKINFENVERLNPALSQHPVYKIAKSQLDAVDRYYSHLRDDSDGD